MRSSSSTAIPVAWGFAPRLLATALSFGFGADALQGADVAPPLAPPVVRVSAQPRQKMRYGMDFERLWSWKGVKEKQRLAEIAVRDCKVDYVRVAISGGAEPEEGVFDPSAYDEILDVMRRFRAANPDIQFFACTQPIHVTVTNAPYTCFPLWISEHDANKRQIAFHPDKAADYLVRYVKFMKKQGFRIAYMDLKNEVCLKLRPKDVARMALRVREQLGADAPLLVTPSSYHYKVGLEWLQEARNTVGTNFFDIASTHNTKDVGSLEAFVAEAALQGKEVWNTELHGWRGPDDLAVANTEKLFHQIRSGVSGINDWLSLGNEIKEHKMLRTMNDGSVEAMRIYYIFKQLVNTSSGGRYLPTTIPEGLTSSAAFIRDDLMTVWLLNSTNPPLASVEIDLGGKTPAAGKTIKALKWDAGTGREGLETDVPSANGGKLSVSLGRQTLLCLEIPVAPDARAAR
jgi:hypothetical protein